MQHIDRYLTDAELHQITQIRAVAFARVVTETAQQLGTALPEGDARQKAELLQMLADSFATVVTRPRPL